jgi:zinc transport system substrate-binding protein
MKRLTVWSKTSVFYRMLAAAAALVCLASLNAGAEDATEPPLSCFVSIAPQAFLVERIGGPYVDVHVMVGPGQSPHTFEPTARLLSLLSLARVYFTIGIAFENALTVRIERSFEGVRIVDAAAGIERRAMAHDHEGAEGVESSSEVDSTPPPDHSQREALDPHVWLSPRLAVTIARNIRDTLVELDPDHSVAYMENHRRLQTELEGLDEELARLLEPHKGRPVFVFHPAYGYFTDAYGLRQVEIEKEGRAPGPRHLAEVIEQAKAEGAGAIFVQPQVSTTQAAMVAETIGVELIELDPLARDYIENLRRMARRIAEAQEKTE